MSEISAKDIASKENGLPIVGSIKGLITRVGRFVDKDQPMDTLQAVWISDQDGDELVLNFVGFEEFVESDEDCEITVSSIKGKGLEIMNTDEDGNIIPGVEVTDANLEFLETENPEEGEDPQGEKQSTSDQPTKPKEIGRVMEEDDEINEAYKQVTSDICNLKTTTLLPISNVYLSCWDAADYVRECIKEKHGHEMTESEFSSCVAQLFEKCKRDNLHHDMEAVSILNSKLNKPKT